MQIKKKVYAALAVCAAVFSSGFTTFAQITEVSCDMNYGVVTFSGKTDALGEKVTYTAFKGSSGDVLSIGEPDVQEDGSFVIKTGFKTSGDYVIKIKDASGSVLEKQISGYICLADRQATLLNQINTGSDTDIKTALDEINFSFAGATWTELTDANLTSWLLQYITEHRTYTNFDELESEYAKLNALYKVNKAKVAAIVSEVEKYDEILGISNDSQVNAFVSGATNAQKSALVSELSNNPATTTQMLKAAIEKANNTQTQVGGGSPVGGRPGGGGSTGGGGGGGIVRIDNDTVKKPDTENNSEIKTGAFSDLSQAEWAKEAIETLVQKKVISGYDDGSFRPNKNVTREEFVKMVVVAFGIPYEGKDCAFLDVFEDDWFKSYVGAAQECGIITGIADDIFGIHKEITRQDAAVILKRAADYSAVNLKPLRAYEKFKDHNDISDYAHEAVNALYRNGTISGRDDGRFAPKDTCTRAETAKMIYGIMEGGSYE